MFVSRFLLNLKCNYFSYRPILQLQLKRIEYNKLANAVLI